MNTFQLLISLLAAPLLLTQPTAAQSSNFFAGPGAGASNTTGTFNTFVGASAGKSNTAGFANSFFGNAAGSTNTTGRTNAFFGSSAGRSNTTGGSNAFFGSTAGLSNTTGGSNAFFGNTAGLSNTTGNDNAFFGHSAGQRNSTGARNTFVGSLAGRHNTTGLENTFMGYDAGLKNITGSGNTYLGFEADNADNLPNLTNATAIGHRALVSRSNALVLGSIAGKNDASSDVNVGIGVDAPTLAAPVEKLSGKARSSSWTVASDERLKKNVEGFTDGLAVLLHVKPVKYHYNGKAQMPTEKEYIGVIAQEMKQVAPYMVGEFLYQDTTGKEETYLNYDASALTYILVNSVKEQQKAMEAMQEENGQLKQELAQIKALLARLPGYPAEGNGSVARLWQNAPNPYERTTVIKYFVPQSARKAAIVLFNSNAQQVSTYHLSTGEGEITLSSAELTAGTYMYKLIVDGTSVDSKKLVILK